MKTDNLESFLEKVRGGKTSVSVGERRGSFAGAGKVEFAVREVKEGLSCD